jgi:hypothetical protein
VELNVTNPVDRPPLPVSVAMNFMDAPLVDVLGVDVGVMLTAV